jgi:uncharacterized membrane protein YkvA (DUF1232 family)
MPLNIVLELSDDDLAYFARVMDSVWKKNAKRPESELIDGARALIKKANKAKAPEYVRKKLEDIGLLIDLLSDKEFSPELDAEDRRRILAAVGYFAVPKDMISDKIPGIGYLDDALVADLVIRELKHDIKGYRDFCAYRDNEATLRGKKVGRMEWLAAKRRQIFARIRKRREKMWSGGASSQDGPTHPILRYKY